jgi:F-type H+-transporting ATPase subunit epsilon
MAATFSISVLTPEGLIWEGRASAVNAPGVAGGFGVLAHHQPMVAALQPGPLVITAEDGTLVQFRLGVGVFEVTAFHDVLVLADSAATV